MSFTRNCQKGFTLVELLVAMAIMTIVTGALYKLYVQNTRTWTCQNIVSDIQQTARATMDTISRDLTMIGYDIKTDGGYKAIDAAEVDRVSFQYRNDELSSTNKYRRYTYSFDAASKKLKRHSRMWDDPDAGYGATVPAIGSGETIAENVVDFSLSYFDASGAVATSTDDIKLIKISIEVQSSATCPLDDQNRSMRLTSEVRPRNMGIGSASADTTDPSCPANFLMTDPQSCGGIDLSWTANSSLEGVEGYVVYYGVSSGVYTSRISLGDVTSSELTGLTNGSTYYAKLTAYDGSGNETPLADCAEVVQALVVDNPGKPMYLDATASITGGAAVFLSWTSNAAQYASSAAHDGGIGPDTDVTKYEVWRKGRTEDDTNWDKKAEVAGATTGSYTDNTLTEANKCTVFDYKIRAVTSCGETDYVSAYSDVIYGDGADPVTNIDPDVPSNGTTNTKPSDTTRPAAPGYQGGDVLSKAGYRRTFINWDNPSDEDLTYVSVRYDLSEFGLPTYPASPDDGVGIENGNSGLFDAVPSATSQAFTHMGSPGCDTTPACLEDGYTYSYSLFAIDTCGNTSLGAETAQTTIGQCGEEPAGPTAGAPSTPQNFSVEACNTYNFKWDRIDDTYPTGEYDLAGYYLYMSEDGGVTYGETSSSILLNPVSGTVSRSEGGIDPDLNASYEGNRYLFKVYSIDCIRETQYDRDPTAATAAPNPVFSGGAASDVITVTPGRLTFANNTGVILTGDLADPTGNPAYGDLAKAFYHNSVKMNIENTSYGPVEWESADISWGNASAYIKAIYRTDVAPELEVWSSATPLASGSTVALSNFRVDGSAAGPNTTVPLRFIFTDAAGNVSVDQDMRQNDITFENIRYAKIFYKGGSELPASCTDTTNTETVSIPLNPRVEGTLQDKPSIQPPTYSWDVPGDPSDPDYPTASGQINVGGTSTVNVYSNVFGDISSLTLYYQVTDKTVTTAPAAGYTPLDMYQKESTLYALYDEWAGADNRIPANPDERIWYYMILNDIYGNFDREPEVTSGTFTYDQNEVDPCTDTPNAPDWIMGWDWGDNATTTLSWPMPSLNTDGSNIIDTITYDIYRSDTGVGGTFNLIVADLANTWYDDAGLDLAANDYVYKVKAKDNCATPNESVFSSTWAECVGAGGGVTVITSQNSITAGDNILLSVSVCPAADNAISDEEILVHASTASGLDEDSFFMEGDWFDDGQFWDLDWGLYGQWWLGTSDTGVCTPDDACLQVDPNGDTITIDNVNYDGVDYPVSRVINVVGDVCGKTPDAPTGLSFTSQGNAAVGLSWTEPDTGAYDNVGLSTYRVYHNVGGSGWVAIGDLAAGTTTVSVNYSGSTATLDGASSGTYVKSNVIQYMLRSVNSCPNESSDSNIVEETKT